MEFKELYYNVDEVVELIELKSVSTLRGRISRGTEHPPYVKICGKYFFPKDLFHDWAVKRQIVWEVKHAS